MNNTQKRIPVTVITGFLGSGKTTLLNRILTENHGKRIAVIENEFGEIGIDHQLVIQSDEEIFEMNNGCICCTVRGDLIRILSKLRQRRDRFDSIIIETTGLADPAPVAQTFFVDEEIKKDFVLDAIVTVVDCKHIWQHIDDSDEAQKQVGFADVVLLNKTDLIDSVQLDALEKRVQNLNQGAKTYRTLNAQIEMDRILNIGGFNLDRAMEVEPQFLEPERPYEWSAIYQLKPGNYKITTHKGPDLAMNLFFDQAPGSDLKSLKSLDQKAAQSFSTNPQSLSSGESISQLGHLYQLDLQRSNSEFIIPISKEGFFALFTEHHPEEFQMKFEKSEGTLDPLISLTHKPNHQHDDEVSSVGIVTQGSFNGQRLNQFITTLLSEKGVDIYRMKGVVSLIGEKNRIIFQGVHMLFEAQPGNPWESDIRENSIIFIGRNLDRKSLTEGIHSCLETKL